MEDQKVEVKLQSKSIMHPVTDEIVSEALRLLNIVFNLPEFRQELSTQKFFCSNRPNFCKQGSEILGQDVYEDFINKGVIEINLTVKNLINPWRRFISKTYGATDINGDTIVTYTWWLTNNNKKELIIEYATHVGHEIFHTKYFQYIHDPEYGSKYFENDKDVTYKIDEIIEKLIRNNYE
jgi:hypothetical protein